MSTHEHTIVVDRPVRVVYNQWTQFEQYPDFMENVETVRQLTDTTTHWRVRVGGVEREYDATITDQRPDEVIAWHTVDGPDQGGMVSFAPVDQERTQVTLRMMFEPDGVVEHVGDMAGVVSASVEHSLANFKEFIEQHDAETGAWRDSVQDGVPVAGSAFGTATGPDVGDDAMGGSLGNAMGGRYDEGADPDMTDGSTLT